MQQEKSQQKMKINAYRLFALFIVYKLHSSHWRMDSFKIDLIPVFSDLFCGDFLATSGQMIC